MAKRLAEFDYLRGWAIALIVLSHSIFLWLDGFPLLLENLLRGGTGLFVFISGFFFHRVFMPRFSYIPFVKRKAQLILIPFMVISFIGLSFRFVGWLWDGNSWDTALLYCWYTVRNGFVLYPHWYIPFIMLTFLMSPLHILFAHQEKIIQLTFIVVFSVIAIFMHRPASNTNFLQSLIYFTPFYLLGILFSLYATELLQWRRWLLLLGLTMVALSAYLQSYVFIHVGNYHTNAFTYAGVDLQFIQVLFGCVAFLELCRFIQPGWLANHLSFLAELSFPIFFIHPLFSMAIENILQLPITAPWTMMRSPVVALTSTAFIFIVQFYGSIAVIMLVKHWLGDRARWVVG
jgi:peptidoglycan/LPS O-acetylase OafA/YrhL